MIYLPEWLERARDDAHIGVMEQSGSVHNHPRILEMHAHTTLHASTDEVPWCSAAVCAWLEESGIRSTKSARARSWLEWGVDLAVPAFGCIVILKRAGPNQPGPLVINAQGHVGLLVDIPTPGEITMIGGNQSNQVCERTYPLERVLGYRWPGGVTA